MSSDCRRRIVGFTAGVVLVLVGAGCSGGSSDTTASEAAGSSTSAVTCDKEASSVGLGEGQLCVDSGFRLSADDFSFPNWSGIEGNTDSLGADTLISLFGAANVCASGTNADDCKLLASAQHTLDEWSAALDGGRCEGMATLSLRFFLGIDDRSVIETGAARTVDMKRPDSALDQDINLWWATQFVPEVQEVAAASRTKSPVQLVNELASGLASGAGYTIGIYDEGYGHAVTPFAITKVNDVFRVHVYDNNFPGEPRYIEVDSSKDEWEYADSTVNPDGTPSVWSGGTGTFEVTPMSARKGPFSSPFHGTDNAKGHVVITAVSGGAGPSATHRFGVSTGLLVTTASGKSVGVQDGKIVNEIPGAHYTIGKGGKGHSLVSLKIPADEEFGVQVVAGSELPPAADSPAHEVSLTVKTKDGTHTRIKTRHRLKHGKEEIPHGESFMRVSTDHSIDVTHDQEMDVAVHGHRESHKVTVPAGGRIEHKVTADGTTSRAKTADGRLLHDKKVKRATKPAEHTASVQGKTTRADGPPSSVPSSSKPENRGAGPSQPGQTTVAPKTSQPAQKSGSSTIPKSTSTTIARQSSTTVKPRSSTTTTVASRQTPPPTAPPPPG